MLNALDKLALKELVLERKVLVSVQFGEKKVQHYILYCLWLWESAMKIYSLLKSSETHFLPTWHHLWCGWNLHADKSCINGC